MTVRPRWWLGCGYLAALTLVSGWKKDGKDLSGSVREDGRPIVLPATASDAGAQVGRRIVRAATLDEAVTATLEALTRGGLIITDFSGATQAAVELGSDFTILPPEAVLFAHEARQHATTGRITLAGSNGERAGNSTGDR